MSVARIPVTGGFLQAEIVGENSSATGASILFLHGWTLDRRMWAHQLREFSPHQVVAIDRRGFGGSTAPADQSLEVDDILRTLDFVGAEQAFIVGMSQSGRIAAEFALRFPARVRGLVLQGARLGAPSQGFSPDEIPLSDYSALVRAGRIDEMKAHWRAHPLMRSSNRAAAETIEAILADYDGRDLMGKGARLAELDFSEAAQISVPTIVITGENDTRQRRRIADGLATVIPNAIRAEISGAGHLCNVCSPNSYNRILTNFIEAQIADRPV